MEAKLIAQGIKDLDELYYKWAFFKGQHPADVEEVHEALGWFCYERGPGWPFAGEPIIWHSEYRTLVTQRCGLDI